MPGKSRPSWIAQIASCSPGGRICAGSPTATQPIGTVAPSPSTVLTCTTPWIRTSTPRPSRAPGKSAQPVARKQPSPTSLPFTCACGPTSTSSPSRAGVAARPRTSACSITTQRAPIVTAPSSAVTTAPNSTRASGPTVTSPHSTAVGATYALGSTTGARPRCSTSTPAQLDAGIGNATGLRLPSRSIARTPSCTSSLLRFGIVAVVVFPTFRARVHSGSVESRHTTS